jgi:hypothetical protein
MAVQEYLQDVSVGSLVKGVKKLKSDGLDEELREVFSGGNPQRMQFD